ncbi:ABC transporter ATP-binding protein, partial [Candidatus Bipolaricaulota bacterium]|nr:ABC transporter ATP-binding protein [Candidatus Bipolaricaulota bacterium]
MSDHFQGDEILGKAFDAQLIRRLLRFLRPYRLLFGVCVLLTIGLAGIQLVIPYFTKTAIDSYMTLPYAIVQLPETPEAGFPLDLGDGEYLVETLNVPAESRREWEEAELLSVERYIFVPQGSEHAVIANRFPDTFTQVRGGWMASERALTQLPIADLETLRGTSIEGIIRLAMMFLIALLAQFVFGVVQVYLLQYTGQRVMYDMRQEIFAHVLRLPLAFFDRAPVGRLVTRVTSDVQAINEMFTSMLVNLFRDAFLIMGIMVVIFQLDWRLSLVIFAFFPVIVVAAWQFRNRVRTAYREVRKQIARLNAYLQESISGMRIIQVFVQEHKANERFDDINQAKYGADMRQLITFAVFRPLMSFLSSFAIALV